MEAVKTRIRVHAGRVQTRILLAAVAASAACGRLGFEGRGAPDAAPDAGQECIPGQPFGAPTRLVELEDPGVRHGTLRLRPDERSGYFWSFRGGDSEIYYVSRPDLAAPFVVEPTTGLTTAANELDPTIAADGSLLVFRRSASGDDLVMAIPTDPRTFTQVMGLGALNTLSSETQPYLSANATEIVFASSRDMPGSALGSLYRADRAGTVFENVARIDELSTPSDEGDPALSADGLTLYFRSDRPATFGGQNIYVATRPALDQPFGPPVLVDNVNSERDDGPSFLSPDDCRLYLSSERDGVNAVYVAVRGVP